MRGARAPAGPRQFRGSAAGGHHIVENRDVAMNDEGIYRECAAQIALPLGGGFPDLILGGSKSLRESWS